MKKSNQAGILKIHIANVKTIKRLYTEDDNEIPGNLYKAAAS